MTRAQATATADPEAGSALVSPQRRNFVFLAIVLGMLLAALDQTIVATALPTIVADLGGAGHQSWVVTSYLLASTIITALVGRLGDLFGRKLIFQAAMTFFVIGSVLCGLSQSMAMLVGARALQGIGGGAITVTASALIGEVIPLRDRGRYQGALGAVFGVTTVIGPLLGGYFTDHLSIAMRPDCQLDVAELWALLRINRFQRALGIARITDIGEQFGIPYEVLEPTFDRLVRGGYAQRDVDRLWLTPAGTREVDFVSSLLQGWIIDKLTRSPNFQGRPDRVSVEAALDRIARRIVAQPDWGDDQPKLSELAAQRLRLAPSGVPSRHEPNRNIP